MNRREFLATTASTLTFLPHQGRSQTVDVLPSDRINIALIGCGTQALRQLMTGWLPRADLQVVALCDPNRDSDDYLDWSPHGLRNAIRRFIDAPQWGSQNGIRAGLIPAKELTETFYARRQGRSNWNGIKLYTDYRELLDDAQNVDAIINMTPEHLHGVINIAGMKADKAVISHKSLANTLHEVHQTVRIAMETNQSTHLMAWHNDPELYQLWQWLDEGVIGKVKEVHNWSNRPVWPQGWLDYPMEVMPIPAGFNWDLWLGCVPHKPYHSHYTHTLFRGWYDFGSGCLGDMGYYSLWRVYRMLNPGPVVRVQSNAATSAVVDGHQSKWQRSEVAFPTASTIHFEHQEMDIFWYGGGMKPSIDQELLSNGEQLLPEGILFIGEHGTILGDDFLGRNFRILPEHKMHSLQGSIPEKRHLQDITNITDEYVASIINGNHSRGSFINVADLAEAIALATISLRTNQPIIWDAHHQRIVGDHIPQHYLTRAYRDGWAV